MKLFLDSAWYFRIFVYVKQVVCSRSSFQSLNFIVVFKNLLNVIGHRQSGFIGREVSPNHKVFIYLLDYREL